MRKGAMANLPSESNWYISLYMLCVRLEVLPNEVTACSYYLSRCYRTLCASTSCYHDLQRKIRAITPASIEGPKTKLQNPVYI